MLLTFIWMAYANVSINLMSMFGLIMALGMLVDNNIVVSDNIYRHLEEGWKLRDAVAKGASEVMMPIAATILTTIASFAPLMFMTGIMGKFVWTLPAVVSVALVASWIESVFFLQPQKHDMQKRRKTIVSISEEEGGALSAVFAPDTFHFSKRSWPGAIVSSESSRWFCRYDRLRGIQGQVHPLPGRRHRAFHRKAEAPREPAWRR